MVPAAEQHPADPGAGGEGEGERDPLRGVRWWSGGQQHDRRVHRRRIPARIPARIPGRIPGGGEHALAAGAGRRADRRAGRDAGWGAAAVLPALGGLLRKEPLGVLQQQPLLALDDHHGVFAVVQAEVDERRVEVQGVATDHVEVTPVVGEDPLQ